MEVIGVPQKAYQKHTAQIPTHASKQKIRRNRSNKETSKLKHI